jgi:tetratricopeptide (TPR) repeat protein
MLLEPAAGERRQRRRTRSRWPRWLRWLRWPYGLRLRRVLLLPVDLIVLSVDFMRILAWYLTGRLFALVGRSRPRGKRPFLPCDQRASVSVAAQKRRQCQPSRKYANPAVLGLLCSGLLTGAVGARSVCGLCRRHGSPGVTALRLLGATLVLGLLWGLALTAGLRVRTRLLAPATPVLAEAPSKAPLTAAAAMADSPLATDIVGLRSDPETSTEPSSEALVQLSESALALGKRDEARAAAEKALQLAPDDPLSQVQMAHVEMAEGHLDAAALAFRRVLDAVPTQVEAGAGLAQVRLAQGDLKAALAQAQAVLQIDPENVVAGTVFAEATLAGGDRAAATELFAKLHRAHPGEIAPGARYADLLLRSKQGSEALVVARRLVAERPGEADAQLVLGDAYLRLNLPEQALECCQIALRYRPQAVMPHLLLARLQMAKENYPAAARELEGLLKLAPDDAGLTLALATCREAEGQNDAAVALCQAAAKAHPEAVAPWLRLARLQGGAGRADEALASARQAVAAAADNPQALQALASLLMEQPSGLAEAFTLATRAYELAPQRPLITDTLGWIYHLQGNDTQASELLERARGALPRHALIRYHYAAVLAARGRTQQAVAELAPALTLPKFRHLAAAQALNTDLQARLAAAPTGK